MFDPYINLDRGLGTITPMTCVYQVTDSSNYPGWEQLIYLNTDNLSTEEKSVDEEIKFNHTQTKYSDNETITAATINLHNYRLLQKSFKKYIGDRYQVDEATRNEFKKIAVLVANLPFEKCAVERTDLNALRFSFSFKHNLILIITKPLQNVVNVSDEQVLFSLFEKRKMIASDVSIPEKLVEGFKEYFS